jgi:TolA-binding protein
MSMLNKTSINSNVKLMFNLIGALSAVIYSWVSMENRIRALEEKILRMEEIDELETQIRMLEIRGKELQMDKLRKRVK